MWDVVGDIFWFMYKMHFIKDSLCIQMKDQTKKQKTTHVHPQNMLLTLKVLSGKHGPGQDASTTVPESEWFVASAEWGFLSSYCRRWQGPRPFMCVDVFSASKRIARTFQSHGWSSVAYDVKTNSQHDITTKSGFLELVDMGLSNLRVHYRF